MMELTTKTTVLEAFAREMAAGATRRGFCQFLGGALAVAAGDAHARGKGKHRGKARGQQHVAAQRKKKKRCKGKRKRKCHNHGGHGTQDPGPVGPRFTVKGRAILDPNGNPVILRGVNKMSVWDDNDPVGAISFPEIRKTGANSVRIVWAISQDLRRNGPATNAATLDALITNARANGLVPMIELHDATGDWARLGDLVAYWTRQPIANIIKKHQRELLVNVGNEVGDDTVGDAQFISGYGSAVQQLRRAGIHTPLVIDAPNWGKSLDTLNTTAAQLLAADPDRNLIFSVHMYWGAADGADARFIEEAFAEAVGGAYPLIVGEFSVSGAYDPDVGDSSCQEGGRVDYQTIIEQCHQYGIGWYAWEWGPGNSYGGIGCDVMDMTTDSTFATLKNGWAQEVAVTSPYSIKNTAQSIL